MRTKKPAASAIAAGSSQGGFNVSFDSSGLLAGLLAAVNVDWFGLGGEKWLARDWFNQGLIHSRKVAKRQHRGQWVSQVLVITDPAAAVIGRGLANVWPLAMFFAGLATLLGFLTDRRALAGIEAKSGDQADFTLQWPKPVEVAEVVYFGRTAWFMDECWKDYEVYLDDAEQAAVKGSLKMMHGPQRVKLPAGKVSKIDRAPRKASDIALSTIGDILSNPFKALAEGKSLGIIFFQGGTVSTVLVGTTG